VIELLGEDPRVLAEEAGHRRRLRKVLPAMRSFRKEQAQGNPAYWPDCGNGLAGNLRYLRLEATAVDPGPWPGRIGHLGTEAGERAAEPSERAAEPSERAAEPGEIAPGPPEASPAQYWRAAYCSNCCFPLGATSA
jgi:hypothetical protein